MLFNFEMKLGKSLDSQIISNIREDRTDHEKKS